MPLRLPFAHLNLTHNPFGELALEEVGTLAVETLALTNTAKFVEELQRPGFVLQVMGACGRGKTSHLLALRTHFPAAPYCHYPEDGPRPEVPVAPVLFLDETQRYTRRERLTLLKRPASFVIGTHEDHTEEFEELGLEHDTLHLRGLSPERLRGILKRRIEAARRGPGPVPYFEDQVIHKLIHTFDDDLRALNGHLYEVFQTLSGVGPVKLEP